MKRINLAILSVVAAATLLLVQAMWAQIQAEVATLIQSGETQKALARIRDGADVNELQPDGTSPLLWAVNRGEPEVVEALLAKNADPNATNAFGASPLTEAAKVNNAGMVRMLLDAGAEVDAANPDGETALMLAIQGGNLDMVEMLLDAGANANTVEQFHQQTPLMYAAAGAQGEMVRLLLAKGADVTRRSLFTDWPSQITSEPRTQYRSVGGLTALLYAARSGCYSCTEQILDAGADIERPTPEGITPLMVALDNENNGVAQLLIERGADIHTWDWWGRTPLWIAVDRKPSDNPGFSGFGGGRGGRGGRGGIPFPAEPVSDQPEVSPDEMIALLLAAGVDSNPEMNFHRPNAPGRGRFGDNHVSTGTTPLFRAVQLSDETSVEALLKAGADPNIDSMGYTAFLLAAGTGPRVRGGASGPNMEMLDLMFEYAKPDINAKVTGTLQWSFNVSRVYSPQDREPADNEGMSALHTAAQTGNLELVQYLLEKGADANLLNAQGKKPIDLIPAPAPARGRGARGGAKGKGKGAPAAKGKGAPKGGFGGARGGRGAPPPPDPADLVEIRSLLEAAAQ